MAETEKTYVGVAPLTMVRVVPAGYVNVLAETPVPSNIDPDDLKRLVDEGFLAELVVSVVEPGEDPNDPESGSAGPTTIKAILAEVGEDKDKAAAALEAERDGQNRPTLVEKLEAILTAGA